MKIPIPKAIIFFVLSAAVFGQRKCIQKKYRGPDNPMNCVCNSTYCDEFPPLGTLAPNQAAIYTSSQSGKRFERITQSFGSVGNSSNIKIYINESQKFQKIIGFGGAFTDAAGVNLHKLSQGAQQNLIGAYFGPEGIGYTLARTPIASCDFSTRVYSYDDFDGDLALENFSLTQEDFNYKIPFLKMAQQLIGDKLKIFGSPWSAPAWMKDSGKMQGGGLLKGEMNGEYYKTWANYFIRYFEEYAKNNITFWGVTLENEPGAGQSYDYKWQAMFFNASMERDFAKGLWGPMLRNNSITKNLKLMIMDDDRTQIQDYSNTFSQDSVARNFFDGFAVHWYFDNDQFPPSLLTDAHNAFPDKWLLYTEACNNPGVKLGNWANADSYAHSIIEVLQHWVSGWTDWNICLDPQGGPNWVNNFVDSPIIVSNTSDEFEKQPMYYALGHFAKIIVPDSVVTALVIEGLANNTNLEGIAAMTLTGQKVIVLNNRDVVANYSVSIANRKGLSLNLNIEARSFTTIVWDD